MLSLWCEGPSTRQLVNITSELSSSVPAAPESGMAFIVLMSLLTWLAYHESTLMRSTSRACDMPWWPLRTLSHGNCMSVSLLAHMNVTMFVRPQATACTMMLICMSLTVVKLAGCMAHLCVATGSVMSTPVGVGGAVMAPQFTTV